MKTFKNKINIFGAFLLGAILGISLITKFYFLPLFKEEAATESSLDLYSYSVLYSLLKKGKHESALSALKSQSESIINEKELILSNIKDREKLNRAINRFEKSEKLLE